VQHDYSKMTQWIFAAIFSTFAIAGPVIGVTFSNSFGIRAAAIAEDKLDSSANITVNSHSQFFCSGWAGSCSEEKLMKKIDQLLN
jgi:L-cystine uptake protein TcyP (sodium:dicarboxylate symporter family)